MAYTAGCDLQVRVHAEAMDPETGHHETTNIFYYTFTTNADPVPTIIPKSYAGKFSCYYVSIILVKYSSSIGVVPEIVKALIGSHFPIVRLWIGFSGIVVLGVCQCCP